jgi:inorganic triphosphatase YgiF
MEIEAKYRVDSPDTFAALLALRELGPYRLVPAGIERQRNTYLDTPDGRFRAQRYGLRLRDLGGRRVATLKGAEQAVGGWFERAEWEAEIGASDDPHDWPPGELRARVLALAGGEPLRPLFTIETDRHLLDVVRGGARRAELCLDEGLIHAGGRHERFREVEIELKDDGTRDDLDAIARLLCEREALEPEDRSKLARGLALFEVAEAD